MKSQSVTDLNYFPSYPSYSYSCNLNFNLRFVNDKSVYHSKILKAQCQQKRNNSKKNFLTILSMLITSVV